ncbi:hypothetical protein [Mycoplasmoides fastidiosum]|uniref:hypothetical protein n=1 Tax=Mycoplasmoides fastidiosum TaxID=92758 RepID=UPI0027D7CA4C|nr:hypothetical protein [Mycoplasmoides fastidiosum]
MNKKILKANNVHFNSVKIDFSFKYFDFSDINSFDPKVFKKTFMLMKDRINLKWSDVQLEGFVIEEKSDKTKQIARKLTKLNDQEFQERFSGKVWDFQRGDTALRVFGVFEKSKSIFYILQIDPSHKSR